MQIYLSTPANLVEKGYQQITDLSSAVGLTVPVGASIAFLQATGDDVRWRDDGTDPTATVGMVLPEHDPATGGVQPWLYIGDLAAIKFIEASGSGVLNVAFYAQVP